MVYKNIKVRLYPTLKQKQMLDNHFDAYRFCYNLCLEYKSSMYNWYGISKSGFDMQEELFVIRRETPWLKKCKAESLRDAALKVSKSFDNFFKGKGYPKYKSKKSVQSFAAYQSIYSEGGLIKFFRNSIKYRTSYKFKLLLDKEKLKRVVFKKDKAGDYWATCLILVAHKAILSKSGVVGLDMGIKTLVVTSDGVEFENKRFLLASYEKIKKLQVRFSRSVIGSNNRKKLLIKIAKAYRKINFQRTHYYHSIVNSLISDNQTIVIETLATSRMMKNHNLARSISDASWTSLTNIISYKSDWNGINLIKVSQKYPSSKTCSGCGNIKDTLSLSQRIYNCDVCGLSIDRDINAAINIRNTGLKVPSVPVEGNPKNPMKQEVIIN